MNVQFIMNSNFIHVVNVHINRMALGSSCASNKLIFDFKVNYIWCFRFRKLHRQSKAAKSVLHKRKFQCFPQKNGFQPNYRSETVNNGV